MKVEDLSLSFRDVARYVVPGSLFMALILWFLAAFMGFHLGGLRVDIGETILFLLAAYVAGHILDVLGNILLSKRANSCIDTLVKEINQSEESVLAGDFRRHLDECLRSRFKISLSSDQSFGLCHTYVRGRAEATEHYRLGALAGMYRGLLTVTRLGMMVSGMILVKHVLLWILPAMNVNIPVTPFFDYVEIHLIASVVLMIFSAIIFRPIRNEMESIAAFYVMETYQAFYTACMREGEAVE